MKCQECEKPATFHITELTGPEPQELHLCEEHARQYLMKPDEADTPATTSVVGAWAQQFKVGQTAEELARLDQKSCPVCGITFYEFRSQGRFGCPHDYVHFQSELEPLVENIHAETRHVGKSPKKGSGSTQRQTELIRLRREMKDAVDGENYERAIELRDEIRQIEVETKGEDSPPLA